LNACSRWCRSILQVRGKRSLDLLGNVAKHICHTRLRLRQHPKTSGALQPRPVHHSCSHCPSHLCMCATLLLLLLLLLCCCFAAAAAAAAATTEPIITLVDGLLEGDHCVADCLAKGNFGGCVCTCLQFGGRQTLTRRVWQSIAVSRQQSSKTACIDVLGPALVCCLHKGDADCRRCCWCWCCCCCCALAWCMQGWGLWTSWTEVSRKGDWHAGMQPQAPPAALADRTIRQRTDKERQTALLRSQATLKGGLMLFCAVQRSWCMKVWHTTRALQESRCSREMNGRPS
jgi:hypothetical protein